MNGVQTGRLSPPDTAAVSITTRAGRWLTLVGAFGLLPVVVGWLVPPIWWLPLLWAAATLAWWRLRPGRGVAPSVELESSAWLLETWPELRRILWRFAGAAVAVTVLVWLRMPGRLFDFPRERTGLWLAVMVLYPLLSVYAQEVLYRRFFFREFRGLFAREWQLVAASAVAFAWMHVIFRNEWAVGLTLIGGAFFADTYRRTGSLRLVCLEHMLYGNLIFTVGLGRFFFHGAVSA